MNRILVIAFGTVCYAIFLATFLYAVAFVGGLPVPRHVDAGNVTGSLTTALLVDVALLLLFAVQHSGMARPGFKRWWTRVVPEVIERSTYVLASSLALIALFWFWQPLPQVVWDVPYPAARVALQILSGVGWLLVLTGTFMINHFELFGLRQVWQYGRVRDGAPATFVVRAYYRIVRHPLMLGFLIAFWSAPTMSVGHLLFAVATTGYILIAVKFLEERDLVAQFGDTYREYQRRVPMILPWPRGSVEAAADKAAPVPGAQ